MSLFTFGVTKRGVDERSHNKSSFFYGVVHTCSIGCRYCLHFTRRISIESIEGHKKGCIEWGEEKKSARHCTFSIHTVLHTHENSFLKHASCSSRSPCSQKLQYYTKAIKKGKYLTVVLHYYYIEWPPRHYTSIAALHNTLHFFFHENPLVLWLSWTALHFLHPRDAM